MQIQKKIPKDIDANQTIKVRMDTNILIASTRRTVIDTGTKLIPHMENLRKAEVKVAQPVLNMTVSKSADFCNYLEQFSILMMH